jgi:hypothetical protein
MYREIIAVCSEIHTQHLNKRCGQKAEYEGEGTAIPLQAWTGLEGSRRLILPDFKTIGA